MATTINAYSVGLHLDARDYINNSKLSRQETSALTRSINQARSPADKYKRQLDLLDQALKKGGIDQKTYNRLLDDATTKFKKAERASSGFSKTLGTIKGRVAAATTALAAYAAASQLKGGLSDSIDAESTALQFKVLIGNAEQAAGLMQKLRGFAAATPFQFADIADAGRQLLAFGFSSGEVTGNLEVLGNLAAGTGNNISELAEIVGKARVQGRLFNEDINQLTGRGINVIDGLARRFGDVKKAAADGRVSFADLQIVLKELATDGGKFAGMMQEMSQTSAGKISTLTDNFKSLRMEVTDNLLPALNKMLDAIGPKLKQASRGVDALFGGEKTYGMLRDRMQDEAREEQFRKSQLLLRNAAPPGGWLQPQAPETPVTDLISNLTSTLDGIAGSLNVNSMTQGLQMAELGRGMAAEFARPMAIVAEAAAKQSQEPSGAVKSLEANSQEAYEYLTRETTAASKLAKDAEKKRAEDMEKGRAQAETMIEHLGKLADWAAENGFQAIR